MATPVDQDSFADLITRFQALITQQQSLMMQMGGPLPLTGAGPVTLTTADHGGKLLLIDNGAATPLIQVNLPADAPVGTLFLPVQSGAGPLKFTTAGASMIAHRLGFNGTAGQWAGVSLTCIKNSDGNSAVWLLLGDAAGIP